jgi:hypothetical protein
MLRPLIILLILLSLFIDSNAQTFAWAKSLGGTNSDYSASIAIDVAGNVYTTGYFLGTADFNPGAGTSNLTSTGRSDIYVSKLDASGNFLWAKRIGGNSWDDGSGVSLDAAGNIYITGHFSGTADFDPGTGTANLTSAGDYDMFVCKLDAFGNFIWAKRIGNSNGDYSWSIVLDAMSNVYITGQFFGTVDFNPGPGTLNMTAVGGYDFFICKLDAAGNFVWAKSLGGLNPDVAYSIAVDASGNVFATGGFNGTVDFDPSASVFNLSSAGSEDVFILKLDATGNFIWAKSFGGINFDSANSMTVDALGNIYTIGSFEGTADFDPSSGVSTITSSGFYDVFVCKLNSVGNFIWAKNSEGVGYEDAFAINTDVNGNVVFSGCFSSAVDFNPGGGVFNLIPAGTQDIFISMLDNAGNFLWAKDLKGSSNVGCGISILVDAANNIYTTGFFSSTVDFNPDAATVNISSAGNEDIFIHKMNYVVTPLPIELISFEGRAIGNQNILYWTTASEINNNYFSLLRSNTGSNFEIIGNVNGAGTSTQSLNYSFIDSDPFHGINYYQLQQTDFNGQTTFSKIIAVKKSSEVISNIIIAPNPVLDFIYISNLESDFMFQVEITNAIGEIVSRSENMTMINVSHLSKGVYCIKISAIENMFIQKIFKQ